MGVLSDDCYAAEPADAVAAAFRVTRELRALLGLSRSPGKEQSRRAPVPLVVDAMRHGQTGATASLTKHKLGNYISFPKNVFRRNHLSPESEAKIRGKPGFRPVTHVFGRFGRALRLEFTARQYPHVNGPAPPLSECLRETTQWRISAFPATRHRAAPYGPPGRRLRNPTRMPRVAAMWSVSIL